MTPEKMSFLVQGEPRPRGFWPSRLGRVLCRLLGHAAPSGAVYYRDELPRARLHVWAWGCPRCALRFHRQFTETPADDGALERVFALQMHEIYLDVLHEMNTRQHQLGRRPLRSVPSLDGREPPQVIRF